MAGKVERLVGGPSPSGLVVEIGALDAPTFRKDAFDVLYVDYAPTAVIKANQFDPSVNLDKIVDVDIVWGERPLSQAVGRPADYVVASHVIEHVPDLIGWLLEVGELLRPGGRLGLAIPDKRYTFDALRQETSLSDVVEAYILGFKRPAIRHVFDAASLSAPVDAAEVWAGRFDPDVRRSEIAPRLAPAFELAKSLLTSPRYNDAHCWVFTPEGFIRLLQELHTLRLLPFKVEAFFPTEPGAAEFHLRLVRTPSRNDPETRPSLEAALAVVASVAPAKPAETSKPESEPRSDRADLPAEILMLRAELRRIYASRSWRLTSPLRALRRMFGEGNGRA